MCRLARHVLHNFEPDTYRLETTRRACVPTGVDPDPTCVPTARAYSPFAYGLLPTALSFSHSPATIRPNFSHTGEMHGHQIFVCDVLNICACKSTTHFAHTRCSKRADASSLLAGSPIHSLSSLTPSHPIPRHCLFFMSTMEPKTTTAR